MQLEDQVRLDESIQELVNRLVGAVRWPLDKLVEFWKNDRSLIDKVDRARQLIPREAIAAVYSAEFANSSVIDDVCDIFAMIKDVLLYRYKRLPWRTAVSAAGLVAYYYSPWNVTAGTAIVRWLEARGGSVGANLLGGGRSRADYAGVNLPDGVKLNGEGLPVDDSGDVIPSGAFQPAGSAPVDVVKSVPTADPNVEIVAEKDGPDVVQLFSSAYNGTETYKVGDVFRLDAGRSAVITEIGAEKLPGVDAVFETLGFDTNGDGVTDVVIRPDPSAALCVDESVTLALGGLAAAATAAIAYFKLNEKAVIEAAKTAEPYLNALDEILIAFLLWKWFKNDLVEYRKWLAAKEVVKDRVEKGLLQESRVVSDRVVMFWAHMLDECGLDSR